MASFIPTHEQEKIIEHVKLGDNIRALAHAGTGKTRTILHALKDIPNKNILFLEFNRSLRLEAQMHVDKMDLHNVDVHNYDSLLVNFYDKCAADVDFEISMARVIEEDTESLNVLDFDVLVIDEAQDMTHAYFMFIQKVLNDNIQEHVQTIIVGDIKQTINQWKSASEKYMLYDIDNWKKSNGIFVDLHLNISHRFGQNVADLVNYICRPHFSSKVWRSDIISLKYDALTQKHVDNDTGEIMHFCYDMDIPGEPTCLLDKYVECVEDVRDTLESVGVIVYSKKQENQLLWKFIEYANVRGVLHLETGEEDNYGGVTIRTLHTTKGKDYKHVFLFICQRHLWLTRQNKLKKSEENLLYVSLTRCKHSLTIVEDRTTSELVFTRLRSMASVSQRNGCHAHPCFYTYCAHSGLPINTECIKSSLNVECSRSLRSFVDVSLKQMQWHQRLSVVEELHLNLRTPEALFGCLQSKTEPLNILESTIISCIIEYKLTSKLLNFQPLLDSLLEKKEGYALRSYTRMTNTSYTHIFLPRFMQGISTLPNKIEDWKLCHWATLCLLHPIFSYGHIHPKKTNVRGHLIRESLDRCFKHDIPVSLVKINPIQENRLNSTPSKLFDFELLVDGHFTIVEGSALFLIITITVDNPRTYDLLAASLAAYMMKVPFTTLFYIACGLHLPVKSSHSIWSHCLSSCKINEGVEL